MDTLTLKGLSFNAKHGFFEEERRRGNDFEVDLIFYANLRNAASKDDLHQTIDYQKAEEIVSGIMLGPSVKLIETLCKKIGDALFEKIELADKLEVCIRKHNPPLQTKTHYSQVCMSWQR